MTLLTPLYAVKPQGGGPPPPPTVNAVMFTMDGQTWSDTYDGYTFSPGPAIVDPDSSNVVNFRGIRYHTGTNKWYAFMADQILNEETFEYDTVYSIWTSTDDFSPLDFVKLLELPTLTDFLYYNQNFYTNGDYWLFPLGGVGLSTSLYKTYDFINFTPVTIPGFYNEAIGIQQTVLAWDPVGNQWVFSGNSASDGASGNTLIATSPDGENWDIGPAISAPGIHTYQLSNVVGSFGNKLLASVIGISSNSTGYIYSSPNDNSAWTLRRHLFTGLGGDSPLYTFCTDGTVCLGVGAFNVYASYNGIDWAEVERTQPHVSGDYCQPLNMFLLGGANADTFIRSVDGFTWEADSDGSSSTYTHLICRQSIPLVGDDTGSAITCYYPPFVASDRFPGDPDVKDLPYSIPDITVNANPHGYFRTFGDPSATFEFTWTSGDICSSPSAYQVDLQYHGEVPCSSGSGWTIQILTRDEGFNGGGFVPLHGVSTPHWIDANGWTNFPTAIVAANYPTYIPPSDDTTVNCAGSQSGAVSTIISSICSMPPSFLLQPADPFFVSFAGGGTWYMIFIEKDEFDVPTGNSVNVTLTKVYNLNGITICNGFQDRGWYASIQWSGSTYFESANWFGFTSDLNAITCVDGILTGTIDATGNEFECNDSGIIRLTMG